ncbi:hypothetical protein ACB098_03G110100 [Castanea mollissima]
MIHENSRKTSPVVVYRGRRRKNLTWHLLRRCVNPSDFQRRVHNGINGGIIENGAFLFLLLRQKLRNAKAADHISGEKLFDLLGFFEQYFVEISCSGSFVNNKFCTHK